MSLVVLDSAVASRRANGPSLWVLTLLRTPLRYRDALLQRRKRVSLC
jgi:hypothetical protein